MSDFVGWACFFLVGAYGLGLLVVLAVIRAGDERNLASFEVGASVFGPTPHEQRA